MVKVGIALKACYVGDFTWFCGNLFCSHLQRNGILKSKCWSTGRSVAVS